MGGGARPSSFQALGENAAAAELDAAAHERRASGMKGRVRGGAIGAGKGDAATAALAAAQAPPSAVAPRRTREGASSKRRVARRGSYKDRRVETRCEAKLGRDILTTIPRKVRRRRPNRTRDGELRVLKRVRRR